MFWVGAVAIAKMFKSHSTTVSESSGSYPSEATGTGKTTAHTVLLKDDRVLMLLPAEPPAFYTRLTITLGAKQAQTCLEPTTFDPQGARSYISIHLMLASNSCAARH